MTLLAVFVGACFGGGALFAALSVCVAASREDDLRDQLHDRLELNRWRRENGRGD